MQDITTRIHHLLRRHSVMLLALMMVTLASTEVLSAEEDVITDIILINGQAELVDFTKKGEVLTRHTAIPDYFSSGRSHKRSLRKSLELLKSLGSVEEVTPKIYHAPVECRQSLMLIPKDDIAMLDATDNIGLQTSSTTITTTLYSSDKTEVVWIESKNEIAYHIQGMIVTSDFPIRKQRLDVIHRSYVVSEDQLLISATSKAMHDV